MSFKTAKIIASLALCATLSFGIAVVGACSRNSNSDNNIGQGNTDTDNTDNGGQTQYSQILQTVLTDSEYKQVIEKCTDSYGTTYLTYNEMKAFPYFFLEEQEHDVASIKNSRESGAPLECKTSIYIKNDDINNLFMSVRIENKGSPENYYTNYVLKYSLTKQEYDELYMLYENNYVQAPLFIQELSRQKTPTVESKINITTSAYSKIVNRWSILVNYFAMEEVFGTNGIEVDIISANVTDIEQRIDTVIRAATDYKNMIISDAQARKCNVLLNRSSELRLNNSIYNIGLLSDREMINLEEFQTSYTPITYFNLAKSSTNNNLSK